MQVLHSHNHDTYTTIHIYMWKHSQHNNDEQTHFFRKIYLSHFSKWLRKGYVWEVSWRLNKLQHIDPSSFVFSSTSFSFCWAAQSGVLRAHSPLLGAGSLYSILSLTHWLQLTELPVAPGYIIVWHPPASCEHCICTEFNPSMIKAISWYPRPDAPVPWFSARSKVSMLHKYWTTN